VGLLGAFLQGNELLIILLILLLILGPTKLPALARGLGQAIREFKKASSGLYDEEEKPKSTQKPITKPKTETDDDEVILKLAEKLGVSTEGKQKTSSERKF
jgi:sec-independent protein translocase protein TatA